MDDKYRCPRCESTNVYYEYIGKLYPNTEEFVLDKSYRQYCENCNSYIGSIKDEEE